MSECLGTDTLVELVEGRADDGVRARVEQHASNCEHCRTLLSTLARDSQRTLPVGSPLVAAPVGDELGADVHVGRYIIERVLGAGGMGVVYAARDPELDRTVAVKVLRGDGGPTMQERLRREAKAMAQLAHPNVVAVHDVGQVGDRLFVAMEYVDGETLAHWQKAPRGQREILDAYRSAGRGLAVAHAAGIVHRDFKPENVLVGKDGRVRVVDFGLARTSTTGRADPGLARGSIVGTPSAGLLSEPISVDAPTMAADLTAEGMMLGTPYYMAPEVYVGEPGDAKSDQFSFSVALFTALYGERPFDGPTLDALAERMRAGKVIEPAAASRVPRRIRAAIRRGLSVSPAARFASMDALLGELEPPGARALRLALPVGGAAIIIGAGIVAWAVTRSADAPPDERCTGGAAAFAPAWNAERRQAIDKAFAATKLPFAAASLKEVEASLDRYASGWITAHTAACRATQILGEQTEATLDRRMLCLARRKQDATALVDLLAGADAAIVGRAAVAVSSLPDVVACADAAALGQIAAPPADPAARKRLEAITAQLADARAQLQTGRYPRALELATAATTDARALAYRPLEADANLLLGGVQRAMGNKAAKASFEAAVWAAEAGHHDEVAARSWASLVFLVGYQEADYPRGAELAQRATAAIARLGSNADISADLEQALGAIAADQGHMDEAVGHFEKAVSLAETARGKDHPSVASALDNLAMAVTAQGHPDRAVALLTRSLAIRETLLGPDHPDVARGLAALGNAHARLGDYARAEAEQRRALAIRRVALEPTHPDIASNLSDLARPVRQQGRADEAIALDREAIAIGEKAFGADNPTFAQQLVNFGNNLSHAALHDDAQAAFARAEAILVKRNAPVASIWIARASDLMLQSKWREAAALYARALPIIAAAENSEALGGVRTNLALAYLQLHDSAHALPLIEAAAKMPRDEMDPANAASIDFILAQALWDSGRDRARAKQLATSARAALAGVPESAAEIDAWLKAH